MGDVNSSLRSEEKVMTWEELFAGGWDKMPPTFGNRRSHSRSWGGKTSLGRCQGSKGGAEHKKKTGGRRGDGKRAKMC